MEFSHYTHLEINSIGRNSPSCHIGDIFYKDEDAGSATFPHATHIEMFG